MKNEQEKISVIAKPTADVPSSATYCAQKKQLSFDCAILGILLNRLGTPFCNSMVSYPNLSGLEMLSRIPWSMLFLPGGIFCVEDGLQPGTEDGLPMIKKDFMEADSDKNTSGNKVLHCAGHLHFPVHMWLFQSSANQTLG